LWDLPAVFDEFRAKCFVLLWRGSRDGFAARVFHDRCDGHANTLTIVQDSEGNIFGGFTPLVWDSADRLSKRDDSMKSFLFSVRNPHGVAPRKFPLKDDRKRSAVYGDSRTGPRFGGTWSDLHIGDDCATGPRSHAVFGTSYANDTGIDGKTFFTREENFTVKEIETFEIVD
jgi:hypothetical protein